MQVVVDAVDPQLLVSDCVTRTFDFDTIREEELHDIVIPLHLDIGEFLATANPSLTEPELRLSPSTGWISNHAACSRESLLAVSSRPQRYAPHAAAGSKDRACHLYIAHK